MKTRLVALVLLVVLPIVSVGEEAEVVRTNDVVLALLNPMLAQRSNGSVGRIGPSSVEYFSGVTNVLHALER